MCQRWFLRRSLEAGFGIFKTKNTGFKPPVNTPTKQLIDKLILQECTLPWLKFLIVTRHDPVRSTLKNVQFFHVFGDFWNYLGSTRAATNNGNFFVFIVVAVVPVVCMERLAFKIILALKVRNNRCAQWTRGINNKLALVNFAVIEVDVPTADVILPFNFSNVTTRVRALTQVVFADDKLGVLVQLFLIGEHLRPRVRLMRNGIQR